MAVKFDSHLQRRLCSCRSSEDRFKFISSLYGCDCENALLDFFVKKPPLHSGGLFHYTTIDAAEKILRDRVLLLSISDTLNDLGEPQQKDMYVASFSHGRIENVAMWGIYARPLSKGVRLRFLQSELRKLIQSNQYLAPVLKRKKEDGSNEYKILQSHLNAVEVKGEACLSDVLYVDHYTGKRDTVVVRWNNHSIALPLGVVVKLKESHLLGLTKYSGWAYERESRFCVSAKIDFEKVIISSYSGWNLASDKVALLLKPDIVRSISVLGGPCVDENDLDRLKLLNGGIANDTEIPTQRSLLYGMIRGGVFCKDCHLWGNKTCRIK